MPWHTNPVDVFINPTVIDAWEIVVDDVHDVTNIKSTSCDGRSDEDGAFPSAERSSKLGQIGDGGHWLETHRASSRSR